jgi:hypothetical protein
MTSDVSALSSIVANGHQALPTFSPPSLKFRTVGFPQYGFKRTSRQRSSLCGELIRRRWGGLVRVLFPGFRPGTRPIGPPSVRPMALGSPASCVVSPDRCLLWPYPRLSSPPSGLSIISARPRRSRASLERVPNLLCQSLCGVPSSILRWLRQVRVTMFFPAGGVFALVPTGSTATVIHVDPEQTWGSYRSCDVRFMLRPARLARPALVRAFTSELSQVRSP